jgi:hypothetical protein
MLAVENKLGTLSLSPGKLIYCKEYYAV